MRVPNFQHYSGWTQSLGILLSGMIIGAAVFMSLYVENFDYVVQQNKILKEEKERLEEQLQTYQQVRSPTLLKTIDITIHNPPSYPVLDDVTASQLQKMAREELKFMIGQEIKRLEPDYIKRLFGKKIMTLEEAKESYVVEINSIFIADTEMRVWLWANRYMPAG